MRALSKLRDGLVGAWCPSVSGWGGTVLRDLSGQGNHGTLTNMDPATDWVVSGGYGALDFDGVDDYTLHPNVNIGQTPTLSFWMLHRGKVANQRVFSQGSSDNNFSVQLLSTGSVRGVLCGDGSGIATTGSTPVSSSEWTHVALSFFASVAFLYVRGTLAVTTTLSGGLATLGNSSYKSQIGFGSGQPFDGLIADCRLYTRVLVPSEIRTLYNGGPGFGLRPERTRRLVQGQTFTAARLRRQSLIGSGVY